MKPHFDDDWPALDGRHRQFHLRTLMLAVAVVAAWLAAMRVPGVPSLVVGCLGVAAGVVLFFAAFMALGLLGFGIFAACEAVGARLRRPRGGDDETGPTVGS